MWQLSAFGSLVTNALEEVLDKAAIVSDRRVDTYVATFYRQLIYLALTVAAGLLGWMGHLALVFDWRIVAFAVFSLPACIFYTVMLRKLEVTGIEAFTSLVPLLFLAIDTYVIGVDLSPIEVAGILLLTAGGVAFAFDARTHRIKRELTFAICMLFVYSLLQDVFEYYLFKDLNTENGINGVTFYANAWLVVTVLLFLIILVQGKVRLLTRTAALRYIPISTLSKSFDVAGALLWTYALSRAAVSQVTAFAALQPIVVFVVAILFQKEMRVRIAERLDRRNMLWKALAVVMLVGGSWMVM